jgi:uncharacterized membrane protein YkgB
LRPLTKRAGARRKKITTEHKQNKKAVHIIIIAITISIITLKESKLSLRGGRVTFTFTMVTISILVTGRTMTIRRHDSKEQLILIIIQLNS